MASSSRSRNPRTTVDKDLFSSGKLVVHGAKEHNLQDVHLELPREKLIVFTGLSGSGKSSLAFDTIYAEGQRRYVESLSSYARQFLGQMDKPNVDFIDGLSPAISIDQKTASHNPRSTVGTVTEVYDYLRLLFARIGIPHCPECGRVIERQTAEQIVDGILELPEGTRFQVLAPIVRDRKGEYETLLADLSKKGFARAKVDGEVKDLSEPIRLDRYYKHSIDVIIDRLVMKAGVARRLTEAVETAVGLAEGLVAIELVDEGRTDLISVHLACTHCHKSFAEPQPRNFSFNSPYGACERCDGLGTRMEVDHELVVPDEDTALADMPFAPWEGSTSQYFPAMVLAVCKALKIDPDKRWKSLNKKQKTSFLYGTGDSLKVEISYKNRYNHRRKYTTTYEGVIPWLERVHGQTESDWSRNQLEEYMRQVPCPACNGARLKPEILAITVGDKSIAEVSSLSIGDADDFLRGVTLTDRQKRIAERVIKEISARLRFLLDVGLDYLTLDRSASTLAGGEAQRIRLATQIGSGLVGVLYILDEPSIGLHQRDNHRLIETLIRLRDLGNTVIVVEHDEATIDIADYIVDIGPGAGEHGGKIVYAGEVPGLKKSKESITGAYLSGRRKIAVPKERREPRGWLEVIGAREHNLQEIDAKLPVGCFVCVTGVSGSGKSTLISDTLLPALEHRLNRSRVVPGKHRTLKGLEHFDKVIDIDQSPIGRTPRSNPATYIGVFDHIRKLFAQTKDAQIRGYAQGRFSFNVKGGRCEACQGDGQIKIEMHFLPDIYVPCEVCKGKRYNRDTLEVRFKGKNINEVLEMSVEEALEHFAAIPTIARHFQTLVDVGLSYMRVGQPATTLSGGEAQRVKLASELSKRATGRTIYLLDEPTTGLHFEDVNKLLGVLHRLVDTGNTVLVIEHNLDVIKTADWILDLGPEGGVGGGTVVAEGTPEQVTKVKASYTGTFLKPLLKG